MSFEYLGDRIQKNPNHQKQEVGILDDAHPGRREKSPRQGDPKFKEETVFVIPKDCKSENPEITKRNEKLVRYYGDIAQHRYLRFNLKEGRAGKKKFNKSWKNLLSYLETAKGYQKDVRDIGGKAVPMPEHFLEEV